MTHKIRVWHLVYLAGVEYKTPALLGVEKIGGKFIVEFLDMDAKQYYGSFMILDRTELSDSIRPRSNKAIKVLARIPWYKEKPINNLKLLRCKCGRIGGFEADSVDCSCGGKMLPEKK